MRTSFTSAKGVLFNSSYGSPALRDKKLVCVLRDADVKGDIPLHVARLDTMYRP